MDKFKGVLKKRINLICGFNGLAVVFIALTFSYGNIVIGNSKNIASMIQGFQAGVFLGLQILFLLYITKYRKALKNDDLLKKLYIEENDERAKLIKDKIGGVGFNFSLGVIATATIISGFFHQMVFATLLGVLIFKVLVKGFLKVYYKRKF